MYSSQAVEQDRNRGFLDREGGKNRGFSLNFQVRPQKWTKSVFFEFGVEMGSKRNFCRGEFFSKGVLVILAPFYCQNGICPDTPNLGFFEKFGPVARRPLNRPGRFFAKKTRLDLLFQIRGRRDLHDQPFKS